MAKPSSLLNKTVNISCGENSASQEIKLDDSNIREVMVEATGLCINSSSWTGIPGYCRFTIALEESEFQQALECIGKLKTIAGI